MKRAALVFLAGLLAPNIAQAQDVVVTQVGTWTILRSETRCGAINRNPNEFNLSPYNGLIFRQDAGVKGVSLAVHFWPGAFSGPGDLTLILAARHQDPFSVPAAMSMSYSAETTGPLTSDQLDTVAKADWLTASVTAADVRVTFKVRDIEAVLAALAECAETL